MLRRGVMLGIVVLLTFAVSAPWAISEQPQAGEVPAYNPPPAPGAKLPPILGRDQLWGNNDQYPYQSHAYELAAKIQKVIYQQPCYCYCDRMKHKTAAQIRKGIIAGEWKQVDLQTAANIH